MRLFVILLALSLILAALPISHSQWSENVEVRVLDAKNRPLPNATVNITWQVDHGRPGATPNKLTNARGRVNFTLIDLDIFNDTLDPYFYVYVKYGELTRSTQYTNNDGPMPRTTQLPVYQVTFLTKDNSGAPISVSLDIDGTFHVKSSADGTVMVPLSASSHTVLVKFRDSQKSIPITVSDDVTIPLQLQLYQLQVRVIDDTGAPLEAQVYVGSDTVNTDKDGYAYFFNITDPRPLLTVHYGQFKKEISVGLDSLNHTAVIFDLHKPAISNLQSVFNGSSLQVRANVADEGDYASGLAQNNGSVKLIYSFGSRPDTASVPMYAAGYNLFEAYIKLPEGERTVHYTVEVVDAEGNLASSSDVFAAAVAKPAPPVTNAPIPSGASKSWVEENAWVVVVFVILMVGGVGYWYYLTKKPPSDDGNTTYTYGKSSPPASGVKLAIKPREQNTDASAIKTDAPAAATGSSAANPGIPALPSSDASPKNSKPPWAPPWAKLPGTSGKKNNNSPPWVGQSSRPPIPSAPPVSQNNPASMPSPPAASAPATPVASGPDANLMIPTEQPSTPQTPPAQNEHMPPVPPLSGSAPSGSLPKPPAKPPGE